MSDKQEILIINPSGAKLPREVKQAVAQLGIKSRICDPAEALEKLGREESVPSAILALEELSELEGECLGKLNKQIKRLSLNLMVLAEETRQVGRPGREPEQGVFRVRRGESAEMLKGRLTMLLEMQGRLKHLTGELNMLRRVGQPMSSYFNEVDEEMRLAARLQRDFLPRTLPVIKGLRFASVFRPATWVSGDIYDIMRLDEDHVGFYVADVVGHGMPAALLTMFIKQALVTKHISGHEYMLIEPGEVLEALNGEFLNQKLSDFQFATCCYGLLNIRTYRVQMANAGHPLPMRIDREGRQEELEVRGSLLGVFPEQTYPTKTFQLTVGDKILLYSDGIEEAFVNDNPDQPLRFREEFAHLAHMDVGAMCRRLTWLIEAEEGSLHPRDDVTVVGVELVEGG